MTDRSLHIRSVTAGLAATVAIVAGLAVLGQADVPVGVAPATLRAQDIAGRLRVFATAGDYKLDNGEVTAVVRRRDGWLTELWRDRPRMPSSRELGATTAIDGLWQLCPIAYFGHREVPFENSRVAMLADGIETEGTARFTTLVLHALTTYRLDPHKPVLRIVTRVDVQSGDGTARIGLGDSVKWGNVRVVVDGAIKRPLAWKGTAHWVGRHGAGGDLSLRAADGRAFSVKLSGRHPGAIGPLRALFSHAPIPVHGSVTITRELAYDAMPASAPVRQSPEGHLVVRVVDEKGRPLPAKMRVDREGHDTPVFPEDGDLDGADRFMWTGNGHLERDLAPGRYTLLLTSGIERDAARLSATIRNGKSVELDARLPRVIDTPGWVDADLHLHQAPSVDADISLANRVVAIAAEGVEFAVASDHYVVTDLAPTVRWLVDRGVLVRHVRTVTGSEVSTLGTRFGHFNVFPLRTDQNVEYMDTTPAKLFASARRASPDGVLQVNHPRMDPAIGYFNYYGVDKQTGKPSVPGFDPHFDTLEVYNGDEAYDLKQVELVFRDWLHLLGAGARYTATGSSDSHNLAFLDPGLPRTLIHYAAAGDDDSDADAAAPQVIAALKSGHAIVSSGPVITATIDGKGPGETLHGAGSRVKLHVLVRAAPWVDVSWLDVYVGGSGQAAIRVPVPRSRRVVRMDRTFDVKLPGKTWIVVAARGTRPLPNVSREGTQPFGFTNPIWLEP